MNFTNIKLLVKKDLKAIVKNKDIIVPMLILPLIFTIFLPILMMVSMSTPEAANDAQDLAIMMGMPTDTDPILLGILFLADFMLKPLFLMIPAMIPAIIAADSFAGEKERKTIESLLALPCSDEELIIGKILTSLTPALIISFACYGAFGAIVNIGAASLGISETFIFNDLSWNLEVFVLAPLLAFLANLFSVIVSARVKNVKAAQGYAGAVVTPVLLLLFLQLFSVISLDAIFLLILSGVFAVLDLALVNLAGKTLNREKLIARLD